MTYVKLVDAKLVEPVFIDTVLVNAQMEDVQITNGQFLKADLSGTRTRREQSSANQSLW